MTTARTRRLMIWGAIGFLGILALAMALRPQPIDVDEAVVDRGPMRVTLDHEGLTRVRDRFVVSAPIPGRVLRIELEPGDGVERDRTVLATLRPAAPALLDARSRVEIESRVQAASATLDRARAERDQAKAASDLASSEARRTRQLVADGLATRQGGESAASEAVVRERALQAAEAAVASSAHELDAARAMLIEPGARATASSSAAVEVKSPVDGVVLRRIRQSEAIVAQGEPLVEVGDPGALEVVADYLSTDAVRIMPGMPAAIDRWGGPAPLAGRVKRVEPSAFLKVSALGVEEQRVWVVIELADPRAAWKSLGDGFRVEARIVLWEAPRALRVPTSALFRQGAGWAAFAIEDGRARVRPVTIGQRNGVTAELTSGLKEGDRLIVHPPDRVVDGARVAVRSVQASR